MLTSREPSRAAAYWTGGGGITPAPWREHRPCPQILEPCPASRYRNNPLSPVVAADGRMIKPSATQLKLIGTRAHQCLVMELARCSVARGSTSCNKVAVGEPAAGSLTKCPGSLLPKAHDGDEGSPAPGSGEQRCIGLRRGQINPRPTCCSGCLTAFRVVSVALWDCSGVLARDEGAAQRPKGWSRVGAVLTELVRRGARSAVCVPLMRQNAGARPASWALVCHVVGGRGVTRGCGTSPALYYRRSCCLSKGMARARPQASPSH